MKFSASEQNFVVTECEDSDLLDLLVEASSDDDITIDTADKTEKEEVPKKSDAPDNNSADDETVTESKLSLNDIFSFKNFVSEMVESEGGNATKKETIKDLSDDVDDVEDRYDDAKKKLVRGFYSDDEFDDVTDDHQKKLSELKDKINKLK